MIPLDCIILEKVCIVSVSDGRNRDPGHGLKGLDRRLASIYNTMISNIRLIREGKSFTNCANFSASFEESLTPFSITYSNVIRLKGPIPG